MKMLLGLLNIDTPPPRLQELMSGAEFIIALEFNIAHVTMSHRLEMPNSILRRIS